MRWTTRTVIQAATKINPESQRRRNDDAERLLGVEVVPSLQVLANPLLLSGDLVLALLDVSAFDLVGTSQQRCLQPNLPSFPHPRRLLNSTFPLERTTPIHPPSLSPQKRTQLLTYSLVILPTLIPSYHLPSLKTQTPRKQNLNPKGSRPQFFPCLSAQSTRATLLIRTNQYITLETILPYGALRRSRGPPQTLLHISGQGAAGHRDIRDIPRKHRYPVLKRSTMRGTWNDGGRPCAPPVPPLLARGRGPPRDLLSTQN